MADDTIFHKILRREIPADIVFEDEHLIAFRDIAPQAPVHVLFVPKRDVATLNELGDDAELVGRLAVAAARFAKEQGLADDGYRLASPVPPAQRRRWRWHFVRSKTRTTLRWFKHIVTFANWLPYVQRKVERHTGRSIQLTTLERKLPILFLWPRAIHVLLTRPRREVDQ